MSATNLTTPPPITAADVTTPEPRSPWWRPERGRSLLWKALFVTVLVLLAILFLYPLEWLFAAAFKPRGETFDNTFLPAHWAWNFTGENLPQPFPQKLFNVAPVGRWMWNSFWISGLGAVLVTFSSALVAFSFSYFRFPLRNFFFGVVLATLMLPQEVTMIPIYLLWNNIGHFTS